MLKRKLFIVAIVATLCLGVFGANAVFATSTNPVASSVSDNPDVMPPDAVGSYTINGEFHWLVPGGDVKIVNFSGMTKEEIFKHIQMAPEDEAKIIHVVPPQSPEVIIDGVTYKSEEIHKFDGQQLGFVTGTDGKLYAFTTEEGLQAFKQGQSNSKNNSSGDIILSIDPLTPTITRTGTSTATLSFAIIRSVWRTCLQVGTTRSRHWK